MKGMTLDVICRVSGGMYTGDKALLSREVSQITLDNRKLEKDGLFAAICGEKVDAHKFIPAAYAAGALCCLGTEDLGALPGPYIRVADVTEALCRIAEQYIKNLGIPKVGITGSVGKTSTKEAVAAILSAKYKVHKTEGNHNNELGVPITAFSMTEDDELAVFEMGIGNFGDMRRLTGIVHPDAAVITNIGVAHMEALGSRDGILKAKTEIFEGMDENGTVILNGDDDKLVTVREVHGKRPLFFGIDNREGVWADQIQEHGLTGTDCCIHGLHTADGMSELTVHIPIPGRHMIYNTMAALLVAQTFGLTSAEMLAGISRMKTIAGRQNLIQAGGLLLIDDCYNANPVSMKSSIQLVSTAEGRKVCILGDMLELGENERQMHREVGQFLAGKNIDLLLTVGTLGKEIAAGAKEASEAGSASGKTEIHSYDTKEQLFKELPELLKAGDTVLIKASNGMGFAEIVEKLQKEAGRG
ncbi:MAG: UDP-N-acetylmuramoyl-tripeptide--D-alanyl-D-alanine ligase [Lachnospiraceae bacterium]|nr:UDP-N-acetylmuramoyl-tripeptide--D-alanyl-D-alanine ligase [Lachnospiraceae bacterium]